MYSIYTTLGIYLFLPIIMAKRSLNAIRVILKREGKSLYWLANETELSYSLLHSYISGKREPGLENLFKIAKHLGVNPKDLINS
jgi:putative transcriptional regulator